MSKEVQAYTLSIKAELASGSKSEVTPLLKCGYLDLIELLPISVYDRGFTSLCLISALFFIFY
jgi:hypothetical protein